jgi:hypothetical protein
VIDATTCWIRPVGTPYTRMDDQSGSTRQIRPPGRVGQLRDRLYDLQHAGEAEAEGQEAGEDPPKDVHDCPLFRCAGAQDSLRLKTGETSPGSASREGSGGDFGTA